MSETAVVQVAEVKQGATGTNSKGQWTRYDLIDGNGERFATFSRSVYDAAVPYAGKRAELEFEVGEKGRKLLAVRDAPADHNGDEPPKGTGEWISAQKPPIEARRIAAAVAWNCATDLIPAVIARQTGQEMTVGLAFDMAHKLANEIFLDLVRKGEVMTDDDIPFEGATKRA